VDSPHRIAREAGGAGVHGEAQLRCPGGDRRDRLIDACDHLTHDVVGALAGGSHEARADDARIIVRDVRDEQSARSTSLEARRQTPALDARQRGAPRVQLADGDAGGEGLTGELFQIAQRVARIEYLDQAGGASGDEEQRLHARRQSLHPLQQTRARLE
jgi:hypothetical protein